MGDMADYTLESIEWSIYNGCDEGDGWEQPTSDKTCRCCGRTGLRWGKRDGKWRLFDNRGTHVCKVNPLRSNGALPNDKLRGTARCIRCGYPQHDMPLDRLDEYACGKYDMKAGQPCGGGYVAVKRRKQHNESSSPTAAGGNGEAQKR